MALLDDFKDLEKEGDKPKDVTTSAGENNSTNPANNENQSNNENVRGFIPSLNNKGADGKQIHQRYSQAFYDKINGEKEPDKSSKPEQK